MPQEERVNVPQSKCNIAVHGAFYEHPFDALNTFNNLFYNCVLVSYLIQSRASGPENQKSGKFRISAGYPEFSGYPAGGFLIFRPRLGWTAVGCASERD